MTVGVAAVAGVPNILGCTSPSLDGEPHPAVLYAAHASGAERLAIGGVQALAAMAFGLSTRQRPTCLSEPETLMLQRQSARRSDRWASTSWLVRLRWPSSRTTP